MVPPRAYLPQGTPNYVTKEGLATLNEELKDLQTERAKAGENYILGNFIDAKMKLLVERISSALVVDTAKANKSVVSFGAWVRYNGRVVRIVGVDEADVDQGLISFTSPIAKALTGKKRGDVVQLKGSEIVTVEEVSYEPMELTKIIREKQTVTTETKTAKTSENTIDQLLQTQPTVQDPAANPSDHMHEPPGFVPEVDPMAFLPIVNERGNIVGRGLYMELHNGNKMLHPVVHLHVMNGKGEPAGLYWWHVAFGDTPEKTLKRKMAEILGLHETKPLLKKQYVRETKTEKELVYVFTATSVMELPPFPNEKAYLELFAKD